MTTNQRAVIWISEKIRYPPCPYAQLFKWMWNEFQQRKEIELEKFKFQINQIPGFQIYYVPYRLELDPDEDEDFEAYTDGQSLLGFTLSLHIWNIASYIIENWPPKQCIGITSEEATPIQQGVKQWFCTLESPRNRKCETKRIQEQIQACLLKMMQKFPEGVNMISKREPQTLLMIWLEETTKILIPFSKKAERLQQLSSPIFFCPLQMGVFLVQNNSKIWPIPSWVYNSPQRIWQKEMSQILPQILLVCCFPKEIICMCLQYSQDPLMSLFPEKDQIGVGLPKYKFQNTQKINLIQQELCQSLLENLGFLDSPIKKRKISQINIKKDKEQEKRQKDKKKKNKKIRK
jgi:hypothetical protein